MAVLSQEAQDKRMEEYQKWIRVAKNGLPDLGKESDVVDKSDEERTAWYKERAEKIAKYEQNPGVAIVAQTRAEIINERKYPVDKNGELTGVNAEKNNAATNIEIENRLPAKEAAFKKGLEDGAKSNFSDAIKHFQNFEIQEGLVAAFKSIGIVGDIMAVMPTVIASLFSGKPISPFTAFDNIRTQRALTGGFENIGITDPKVIDSYSNIALSGAVADVKETKKSETPKPSEAPKSIESQSEKQQDDLAEATATNSASIKATAQTLQNLGVGLNASSPVTGPMGNMLAGLANIAASMQHVDTTPTASQAATTSLPETNSSKGL